MEQDKKNGENSRKPGILEQRNYQKIRKKKEKRLK